MEIKQFYHKKSKNFISKHNSAFNLRGSIGRCCVFPDVVFLNTHFFRLIEALVIGGGAPKITQLPHSIRPQEKILSFQVS